jgi:hypothetical protein
MTIKDDARSGRPKEGDRKVKLIEITETLKISKERLGHIVYEYLDMGAWRAHNRSKSTTY